LSLVTWGFGVINNMLVMGLTNVNVKIHYEGEKTVELPLPGEIGEAYKKIVGERQLSHHYPAWRACDLIGHKFDTIRWITTEEVIYVTLEQFIPIPLNDYVRQMLYEITATYLTEAFYHLQDGEIEEAKQNVTRCMEVMSMVIDYFKKPQYTVTNDIRLYPDQTKYSHDLTIYTRE